VYTVCNGRQHLLKSTHVQSGSRKPDCLTVDNFATVCGRKSCSMSKVSEFFPDKNYKTCMSLNSSILRLICINHETPEIILHLTIMHDFFSIFTQRTPRKHLSLAYTVSPERNSIWAPYHTVAR